MSNPLLDDIGNYLIAQNLVEGSTGWTLCQSFLPPSDPTQPGAQTICLFETPGEPPEIVGDQTVESSYDTLGLQIRGRGAVSGYQALRAQMQAIYLGLHQKEPAVVSGMDYIFIYAKTSGPLPMGKDQEQHDELTWNFRLMRKR
jgi:hypothetical protein